jgi:hypothetical protein
VNESTRGATNPQPLVVAKFCPSLLPEVSQLW